MRSGDRPGLQNRRAAGNPVTGGFDPHSLPPIIAPYLTAIALEHGPRVFPFGLMPKDSAQIDYDEHHTRATERVFGDGDRINEDCGEN
jgi:hypothetical protein